MRPRRHPHPSPPPEPRPEPWTLPSDYLRFDGACTAGTHRVLAFAGDLLLHQELQKQAYKAKEGAAVLWPNIADLLASPDAMLLNLEGPLAPGLDVDGLEVADPGKTYDRVVYTGPGGVKREIGCQRVDFAGGWHFIALADNYDASTETTVGADKLYLVSDNRMDFFDSRDFGTVAANTCTEKVFFRLWSKEGFFSSHRRFEYLH